MRTNNYDAILEEYSSEYYFLYAGKTDDSDLPEWKNVEVAKNYLDKYLLDDQEYEQHWVQQQRKLYSSLMDTFPDITFPNAEHLFLRVGGTTMTAETLLETQNLMKSSGEEYFLVIQNDFGDSDNAATNLKMKFPVSVVWEELMSGGFISTVLFEMFHKDYFIFGGSGSWARYVANDHKIPIDILAVNESLSGIVKRNFENDELSRQALSTIVPKAYKGKYEIHF